MWAEKELSHSTVIILISLVVVAYGTEPGLQVRVYYIVFAQFGCSILFMYIQRKNVIQIDIYKEGDFLSYKEFLIYKESILPLGNTFVLNQTEITLIG